MKTTRQSSRHSMSAAAVAKAGERQLFAEDAALLQRFEHGAVAVRMQAQKRGTSGEQYADHILLLTAGEDRLPGSEALLIGAEAAQHVSHDASSTPENSAESRQSIALPPVGRR